MLLHSTNTTILCTNAAFTSNPNGLSLQEKKYSQESIQAKENKNTKLFFVAQAQVKKKEGGNVSLTTIHT